MKIDLHYGMDPSFGPDTHERAGIGGTENFITYSSEYLAAAGHNVRVFNKIAQRTGFWYPLRHFKKHESRDVLMSFRTREIFDGEFNAHLTVVALADTESHGLGDSVREGKIDLVIFVSQWQHDKIAGEEGIAPENALISSNGVSMRRFDEMRGQVERVPGKCIHLATPERGLEPLLDIWPAIQREVPGASLHLFSSFKGWRVNDDDNANMCGGIYDRIKAMIADGYHIVNHQHANAAEIRRHLLESQLYLYPTRHFSETCCISALEASAAGVPIVATARAALMERVNDFETGLLVPEFDGHDTMFADSAIRVLQNWAVWEQMSLASVDMARRYDYGRLVRDWAARFEQELARR